MLENDSTDSARQDNHDPALFSAPLMVRGALYSVEQVMSALRISERTLAKWKAAGLRVRQPATKRGFLFSDDVFEVILKLSSEEEE